MDRERQDWEIHYVSNSAPCIREGRVEKSFPEHICDAHTHGMNRYGHLEFQVVIDYGPRNIGYLLNTMGYRVKAGETFRNGDLVKGLLKNYDVQIRQMTDSTGEPVLRLVIPDKQYRWPENAEPPYQYQMLATHLLYLDSGTSN